MERVGAVVVLIGCKIPGAVRFSMEYSMMGYFGEIIKNAG
jgi:hypothetical protein